MEKSREEKWTDGWLNLDINNNIWSKWRCMQELKKYIFWKTRGLENNNIGRSEWKSGKPKSGNRTVYGTNDK